MRAEDREVDGPELERAERERATDLEKEDEESLAEPAGRELADVDREHRDVVLAAMRAILGRNSIVINDLHLAKRELRALEALKAAVDGRDAQIGQFVYAHDRSAMLEQALAVLQPTVAEMPHEFAGLVHRVADLRHGLRELEDSQDELIEAQHKHAVANAGGDSDDKPADGKPADAKPAGGGPDRDPAKPATTLTGPERPAAAKPTTSLTGSERAQAAKPATTLTGPERVVATKPTSGLAEESAAVASELAAAAIANATTDATSGATLDGGATDDDAAPAKKKPWWRRPFGG